MRQIERLVLSAALLLVVSIAAHAQVTTSTLVGLVRDAQNAVIPGATVVATHEGTGVSREGVTDGNGEFVFSALPAGPYTVKIELTGFKGLENRGMQLAWPEKRLWPANCHSPALGQRLALGGFAESTAPHSSAVQIRH